MATVRRYYVLLKLDDDESINWDDDVARVVNGLKTHGSLTSSYNEIFKRGIKAFLDEKEEKGEKPSIDTIITRKINEVEKERARKRKLEVLYDRMGFDDFVVWCDDVGENWQAFLEDYDLSKQSTLKWSEKALLWLKHTLRDREALDTATIRQMAIDTNLINDSDQEWTKLRVLAHRNRFTTSEKSWWKLPVGYNR